MRKIKFRAWNGKKMIYPNDNGWYEECYMGDNGFPQTVMLGTLIDMHNNNDRIILLQYIRTKDEEGREVYVGDIYEDEENMLWEVIFDEDDCVYILENLHTPGRTTIRSIKDMNHVGNVYENSELVE